MKVLSKRDLPYKELEQIGLYEHGRLKLVKEDINALLSGRRTGWVTLENLKSGDDTIKNMDVKLSLLREPDGTHAIEYHPIYKEARNLHLLEPEERQNLISGKAGNVLKTFTDQEGQDKKYLIEYDKDTREFIATDTAKIAPPHSVNSKQLTPQQKKKFREGEEVELAEATKIQYTGTDKMGVRANRTGLALSILLDGGISYFIITGLQNLRSNMRSQDTQYTGGYNQAVRDMQEQSASKTAKGPEPDRQGLRKESTQKQGQTGKDNKHEHSRGYSRRGISR